MDKAYTGTITGERANRYPSYAYRTTAIKPLTLRDFDPDRVNAMSEYPRWSSGVSDFAGEVTSNIDYAIVISHNPNTFTTRAAVVLRANQHTSAKQDAEALTFEINELGYVSTRDVVDEALRRAFD